MHFAEIVSSGFGGSRGGAMADIDLSCMLYGGNDRTHLFSLNLCDVAYFLSV